ncbi:hypothetical protein ACFOPQ_05880 [Deinococcus antarcticus]|uniref:Uncharacterized protein n=1 Tax=Deinococcus antarcticus TaxID=1298767 RepID=A0ABV8A3R0_9DEIO
MDRQQALSIISGTYTVLKARPDETDLSLLKTLENYSNLRREIMELFPEIYEYAPGIVIPRQVEIITRAALGPGYPAKTRPGVNKEATGSIKNEL